MTPDEKAYYRALGRNIRMGRRGAGLTQEELGDEVDLSRTSITNIENGNQPVSARLLEQMARALNCQPAELLTTRVEQDVTDLPADLTPRMQAVIRSFATQP